MSEKPQESLSKTTRIAVLRDTIQRLERVINQLDTETATQEISQTSFENLVASTEEIVKSLESDQAPQTTQEPSTSVKESEESADDWEIEEIDEQAVTPEEVTTPPLSWIDRILPSFSSLQKVWDQGIGKIRALLPEGINSKLSDLALTGIVTGVVVTGMVTTVFLLPDRPIEIMEDFPEGTDIPLELTAPRSPQLLSEAPPPVPKLTPEQQIITVIQTQLSQITDDYEEDLINSIDANFVRSRLVVEVGQKWYDLPELQQDRLATEIFLRAQKLDFRKLEMLDKDGIVVARSPVVGQDMLIFKRQQVANAIDSL